MSGTSACEGLDLLAFAGAEDAIEDAHGGRQLTGRSMAGTPGTPDRLPGAQTPCGGRSYGP